MREGWLIPLEASVINQAVGTKQSLKKMLTLSLCCKASLPLAAFLVSTSWTGVEKGSKIHRSYQILNFSSVERVCVSLKPFRLPF